MTEKENLSSWQHSGQPHVWVWDRSGVWSDDEYARLIEHLRESLFWPMTEDDIKKTLEAAATIYRDLERWHLLGEAPAPPKDEDIFF